MSEIPEVVYHWVHRGYPQTARFLLHPTKQNGNPQTFSQNKYLYKSSFTLW